MYSRTVFHIAATHGHYECLKVLCTNCNDKDRDFKRKGLLQIHGASLLYAVQNSNTYCAKLLFETVADPNSTQLSGCTSLYLAAVYGFSKYGANVSTGLMCMRRSSSGKHQS